MLTAFVFLVSFVVYGIEGKTPETENVFKKFILISLTLFKINAIFGCVLIYHYFKLPS